MSQKFKRKLVITIKFTCHITITIIYKHKIKYQEDSSFVKVRIKCMRLISQEGSFQTKKVWNLLPGGWDSQENQPQIHLKLEKNFEEDSKLVWVLENEREKLHIRVQFTNIVRESWKELWRNSFQMIITSSARESWKEIWSALMTMTSRIRHNLISFLSLRLKRTLKKSFI